MSHIPSESSDYFLSKSGLSFQPSAALHSAHVGPSLRDVQQNGTTRVARVCEAEGTTYSPRAAQYATSRVPYSSTLTLGKSRGANLFETDYQSDVSKWYFHMHMKHRTIA